MYFTNPAFLWALLALAIPIAIHLFNFQRPKQVFFPSIKFLKQVQQQTRTLRELKKWLVLAARCLFLTFLVLAFAQPIWNVDSSASSNAKTGQKIVGIYIDNSNSLQVQAGKGTALDVAISAAERAVNQYNRETKFHLVTNDFTVKGGWFVNKDEVLSQLRSIDLANNARTSAEVIQRFQTAFATENSKNREVLWFSDFQKSTLGTDFKGLVSDSNTYNYLFPISTETKSNVVVDSVWLETPFVQVGVNNTLNIRLHNYGEATAEQIAAKVFLDNKQIGASTANLSPNSNHQLSINFSLSSNGTQIGKIEINDAPVVFDNSYFFALKPAPKVNVVVVQDLPNNAIQKVFNNPSLFNTSLFTSGNINYSKFSEADIVVISQLGSINSSLTDQLVSLVNAGKSILVIPSLNPDKGSYQNLFTKLTLGNIEVVNSSEFLSTAQTWQVVMPNKNNVFFKDVFESVNAQTAKPFASPSVKLPAANAILNYQSGETFFSKYNRGNGQVLLLAAPAFGDGTNLNKQSLFLPLLYKAAFGSLKNFEPLSYTFGTKEITLNTQALEGDAVFSLVNGSEKVIPAQQQRNGKLVLEVPKKQMPAGVYSLTNNKGEVVNSLAFNYSHEESDLSLLGTDGLLQLTANAKNIKISAPISDGGATADIAIEGKGTALWKYFIIVALGFLLAEILILRFWK
jgi:hypothetical protein